MKPIASDWRDATQDLTDEQVLAALAVVATTSGAAALLSAWHERTITPEDVLKRVAASERLQRIAAFCGKAQDRSAGGLTEERIRALAGPRRWRERRARM
jgi:hypothetical protein